MLFLNACSGGGSYYFVKGEGLRIDTDRIHFEAFRDGKFLEQSQHVFKPSEKLRLTLSVKDLKTQQGQGRVRSKIKLIRDGQDAPEQPSQSEPVLVESHTQGEELLADTPLVFTLPATLRGRFELQVTLEDTAEPENRASYHTDFRLE